MLDYYETGSRWQDGALKSCQGRECNLVILMSNQYIVIQI